MLRIFPPDDPGASECYRMQDEKHGVKPVLKGTAILMMNELVLRYKETGKGTEPEIDILMVRRIRKIMQKQEGRQHRQ